LTAPAAAPNAANAIIRFTIPLSPFSQKIKIRSCNDS
jgi:hypothetical protein